jgi:hypothetical protein
MMKMKILPISESVLADLAKEFTHIVVQSFSKKVSELMPDSRREATDPCVNATKGFLGLFASWQCKHYSMEELSHALGWTP